MANPAHFETRYGRLTLHYDAKTSPVVGFTYSNGWAARVANAFPLPAGTTCPGMTHACSEVCYAGRLEVRSAFMNAVTENHRVLLSAQAVDGCRGMTRLLVPMVRQSANAQYLAGIDDPTFRWHSDGDVFSLSYARAIAATCEATPMVRHWIYTRTLSAVPILSGIANLSVYVSVDRDNINAAAVVLADDPTIHAAVLAGRHDDADAMLADVGRSAVNCPATARYTRDGFGASYVVGTDGRRRSMAEPSNGSRGQGACHACAVCIDDRRSVVFYQHGGRNPRRRINLLAEVTR